MKHYRYTQEHRCIYQLLTTVGTMLYTIDYLLMLN